MQSSLDCSRISGAVKTAVVWVADAGRGEWVPLGVFGFVARAIERRD